MSCSLIVKLIMMDLIFALEEKLAASRMTIKFSPKDPDVNEDVTFSVHHNYTIVSKVYYIQIKC